MNKNYRDYLRSYEWKKFREKILKEREYKCEICGSTKNLQIHHLTYEHIYNEESQDVIVVCKRCHMRLHKNKKNKKGKDKFFRTYFDSIHLIFKLKSAVALKLIVKMCSIAEYNTGKVYLTPAVRKEISDELGISNQQITNSLRKLKEVGLIFGEKGTFQINPLVFWKGEQSVRDRILEDNKLQFKINFIFEKEN